MERFPDRPSSFGRSRLGAANVLVRIVLVSALASGLVGAIYGYLPHDTLAHDSPAVDALATAAMLGAVFGAVFSALEVVVFQGVVGAGLWRSPFLVYAGVRAATYLVLIILIFTLVVRLMYGAEGLRNIGVPDFAFAFLVSVAANLMAAIADLLGPGVLIAFAAGRYHRPRPEERARLVIDLCGSTAKAERLGQARFLAFLDAFIVDVTRGIVERGGEIHRYVGYDVIATWRLRPGRNNAAIVRACLSARDRLASRREAYRRALGECAEFRAALHAGVVVVGEIGLFKKEIALVGDPMNTAARHPRCRDLGVPTLASSALIDRLDTLPQAAAPCAMAPLPLRGKVQPLELFALDGLAAEQTTTEAVV